MTPIILPEGTGNRWQHCINTDHWEDWDNLAPDLLDAARDEPDVRTKDDILTLCLVAAERANMAGPATGYSMDLFTQEAA